MLAAIRKEHDDDAARAEAIRRAEEEAARQEAARREILNPRTMDVGDKGVLAAGSVKVLQVIDKSSARVSAGGVDFFLRDVNTSGMVDDRSYAVKFELRVARTVSYSTVLRAKRTIFGLEPTGRD